MPTNNLIDVLVTMVVHGVVSLLVVVGWALLLTPVWVLFNAARVASRALFDNRRGN